MKRLSAASTLSSSLNSSAARACRSTLARNAWGNSPVYSHPAPAAVRGFHASSPSSMDMREALNQAFSFKTTPQQLEASALFAKKDELPEDIDFELQLPLLKTALSQHKKADVIRLMKDLARANASAKGVIQSRVEKFTKQMEDQMAEAQQKAASSSNAAKLSAAPKIDQSVEAEEGKKKKGTGAQTPGLLPPHAPLPYFILP
jgi:hypothetical protein